MRFDWSSDWRTSCYYLAWRSVEAELSPGIETSEPSPLRRAVSSCLPEFRSALIKTTENEKRSWSLLPLLANHASDPRQLAQTLITRVAGRAAAAPKRVELLMKAMAELETAALEASPDMANQLTHRIRPIREAWEAVGPGLIQQLARQTDGDLFVESARAIVVEPIAGGGEPYLDFNAIVIEGVLAHPIAELPETLRIAWMAPQLNNDLPIYSELIPGPRFLTVSKLAMIPPTIAGGQAIGICRDESEIWNLAIQHWLSSPPANALDVLAVWWPTYREGEVDWRTALTALDRLLTAECGSL